MPIIQPNQIGHANSCSVAQFEVHDVHARFANTYQRTQFQSEGSTLNKSFTASMCLTAMIAAPAFAQDEPPSPEKTAAHFIAAFYNVKPEQVAVTMLKREKLSASAVTAVEGKPSCTLDMAPAPDAHAKYGWLIGGLACDQIAASDGKG